MTEYVPPSEGAETAAAEAATTQAPAATTPPAATQPAARKIPTPAKVAMGCGCLAIVVIMIIVSSIMSTINSINRAVSGDGHSGGLSCVYPFVLDNGSSVINGQSCTGASQPSLSPDQQLNQNKSASFATTLTNAFAASNVFTDGVMSVGGAWGPMPCSSNVDECVTGQTVVSKSRDDAAACKNFSELAGSLGATHWYDSQNLPQPIDGNTQQACVDRISGPSRSVGWGLLSYEFLVTGNTADGVPFGIELDRQILADGSLQGNATPTPTSTPWVLNNALPADDVKYSVIGGTIFESPVAQQDIPDFSQLNVKAAAYLDLIAHYRAVATEADPSSLDFNQNVLNAFAAAFPDAKQWRFAANGQGKVFRISVTDGSGAKCLAIGHDYLLAKSDFPSGLPRGMTVELMGLAPKASASITDASQFGDWAEGACR